MSATTTHELSAAIRAHHRALADTLDTYTADVEAGVGELDAASLAELLNGLTGFLSRRVDPTRAGEEKTLYPALDPIIREHGSPTATMRVDHEYIGDYARQIAETARALRSADQHTRTGLARTLARQLIQLQGLFGVHLAKEERVYLPLIEQAISAGDQQALLAALHEEADGAARTDTDRARKLMLSRCASCHRPSAIR